MKDWHSKPPQKIRSVNDALHDASRLRTELPITVQVGASDWDKVILADEIDKLRSALGIIAAQDSGRGSTNKADCMAAIATIALRNLTKGTGMKPWDCHGF